MSERAPSSRSERQNETLLEFLCRISGHVIPPGFGRCNCAKRKAGAS